MEQTTPSLHTHTPHPPPSWKHNTRKEETAGEVLFWIQLLPSSFIHKNYAPSSSLLSVIVTWNPYFKHIWGFVEKEVAYFSTVIHVWSRTFKQARFTQKFFEAHFQKNDPNWGFPFQSFNFTAHVDHLQTQLCLPQYIVLISVNWWWSEANSKRLASLQHLLFYILYLKVYILSVEKFIVYSQLQISTIL